jgi:NADPH:quinone reductase-like Zn-dependent oxidoreductase
MKAVRVHNYGPPSVLVEEEVSEPTPGEVDVVLQVFASGVGPWDALLRTGADRTTFGDLPLIPGSDVAGVVEAVGSGVKDLRQGDRVYGSTNPQFTGGYAEYCDAVAGMLAPMPRTLDFVHAAAVPVVAVEALQMLFQYGRLTAGETVLVQGAAGSVGSCVVQLAHQAGATVIGTASGADVSRVRELGADLVIDYRAQRFEDFATNVDLVADTVGGETQTRSFSVLRSGGRLVSSVSQPDKDEAARRGVLASYFLVEVTRERLASITDRIEAGRLSVEVGEVLPLAEARHAHEMLEGAPHRRGKIVLRIAE